MFAVKPNHHLPDIVSDELGKAGWKIMTAAEQRGRVLENVSEVLGNHKKLNFPAIQKTGLASELVSNEYDRKLILKGMRAGKTD